MKKLAKVLVVFKKSTFQLQAVEHREPRFLKLLEEGHKNVAKVKAAHEEHYETLEALKADLEGRGVQYECVARADLKEAVDDHDLIISVGGDGTFLDASHAVHDVPLLGINSARSTSFGHFCLGNIDNLSEVLDKIEAGDLEPWPLLRLELQVNGNTLPELVLNEVLVCHSNPAGTSRYFIEIEGVREEQRSSGVWIGTASGSTGSLKSAGGVIMPIISQQFQYMVREPWTRPNQTYQLTGGVLERNVEIHMSSYMRTGALYIDGQHIDYSFTLGDEVVARPSRNDLMAYVDPRVNDIFSSEG
jgi:NAD+ kinase